MPLFGNKELSGTAEISMDVDFEFANISLPALPAIRSDSIRKQVFTHRSLHAQSTLLFEYPQPTSRASSPVPDGDNERLEFLGDSILHFCATLLLHRILPRLKCGPATAVRGIILSNRTFAAISKRYGLIEHLLSDPNNSTDVLTSSKIQADLFEAYIAGMYLDKGLEVTQEYLSQLLEPYALAAYRAVRYQHGFHDDTVNDRHNDTSAAPDGTHSTIHSPGDNQGENVVAHHTETATLHQYTEALGEALEYTFRSLPPVNGTPWWESTVMVDDHVLATARGTTKKAAKNYAAALGIEEIRKRHPEFTKDMEDEEIILRPSKRKRRDSHNPTKILKKNNLNVERLNWEDLLRMDLETGTTSANSQDISEDMRFSGADALLTAPTLPISGKDATPGPNNDDADFIEISAAEFGESNNLTGMGFLSSKT